MSSQREVFIRILALLQRKTLIETKSRTLKWHYWTVRSIKNVALLTEDGAFALFFLPHPGGFASSRVPTPGNLPSKAKKMLMPGGQPGERGAAGRSWNWLMDKTGHLLVMLNFYLIIFQWQNIRNCSKNVSEVLIIYINYLTIEVFMSNMMLCMRHPNVGVGI